jgi:hypothetical protein
MTAKASYALHIRYVVKLPCKTKFDARNIISQPQNAIINLQIDSPPCSYCRCRVIVQGGGVVGRGDSSNHRQ